MIRIITVLLFGFVFYFVYVQALECGIAENMGEANLQNVIKKCMIKKSEESEEKSDKVTTASSGSSEESEHSTSGVRRGLISRTRRSPEVKPSITRRDTSSSGHGNGEEDHSGQNTNDTMASDKCALQCIFGNLGMTDGNGYPDHNRVAQALLKNAKGRELRDFFQDSTDECFQLMEQGEKLDACEYSTHLVTCMAEKGRSNCGDWQATNLPFHSYKAS